MSTILILNRLFSFNEFIDSPFTVEDADLDIGLCWTNGPFRDPFLTKCRDLNCAWVVVGSLGVLKLLQLFYGLLFYDGSDALRTRRLNY